MTVGHDRGTPAAESVVVFTGAGISGEAPASLPRGFGLRNDVLRIVHAVAARAPGAGPLVTDEQRDELLESHRKLEVVLGRVWGTIGDDALACLLTLSVAVPNEAHMLAAVHLARGGTHVTLNFDVGIELAYDLLTGRAALGDDTPAAFREMLPAWQSLVPAGCGPLRVAASRSELDAWNDAARPAALLKPHGSLSRDQTHLVDVVVVDIEELGQLAGSRRAAVERVADAEALLVTGYSGADPDVYRPLLDAAPVGAGRHTAWHCSTLVDSSPVRADTAARGIDLVLGEPDGLAATALRKLLGLSSAPSWPELPVPGPAYGARVQEWARRLEAAHRPEQFAQAGAWLLADLGDLDAGEAIAGRLAATGDAPARMRHAEILYTRARGTDRHHAARLFNRIGRDSSAPLSVRTHCLLRAGDVARGRALRGRGRPAAAVHLAGAFAAPVHVLWLTRNGRRDVEAAADAFRALQQTGLRLVEGVAAAAGPVVWPPLALAVRALVRFGHRAERLAGNGNRRALVRQHRMLLTALAALFAGRRPPDDLDLRLGELHDAYQAADDLPGAANCTAARAVVAVAAADVAAGRAFLDTALHEYSWGRADRSPLPSGAALVSVLDRIFEHAGRRREPASAGRARRRRRGRCD